MCQDVSGCVRMCQDVSGCVMMCQDQDVSRCVKMCQDVSGCVRMCQARQAKEGRHEDEDLILYLKDNVFQAKQSKGRKARIPRES